MKLIVDNEPYLTKRQIFKVLLALNIMVVALYLVAMIFSLCGSPEFIINYHNDRLNQIYNWLNDRHIYPLVAYLFSTLEFFIITWFILDKRPNFLYPLIFYAIPVIVSFITTKVPLFVWSIYPIIWYFVLPVIDRKIYQKHRDFNFKIYMKDYGFKVLIAMAITYFYQFLIYIFKTGILKAGNSVNGLELAFIFNLEYYIALIIAFSFVSLCFKEKGDNKLWATYLKAGGFSQMSKKKSQRLNSNPKKTTNLTKAQQKKLRLFYAKVLICQCLGFLLLMVLPVLLGKLFEFLMMYFAFALVRAILGFKYSLHYKKESICIFVGVVVFAVLTLVIPFFHIVVIMAIAIGTALAIILHLSYKYRGMWLFLSVVNKDRYAELYTIFDGNIEYVHIMMMAKHYGIEGDMERHLLADYMTNFKLSYLAKKYNYSIRQINYKLDEILETIKKHL